jgi:hypothetical protein
MQASAASCPASYCTALGIFTFYCLWDEVNNKVRYIKKGKHAKERLSV